MSLVNDVLRQLDADSAKPYRAMPLHSVIIEQPVKKNKLMSISFILLVGLLFFILTLQIFYNQSLADIFYINDVKQGEVPPQLSVSPQSNGLTHVFINDRADKNSNSNANDTTTFSRLLITEGANGSVIESDRHLTKKSEVVNNHLTVSQPIKNKIFENSSLKVKTVQDILGIKNDRVVKVDNPSRIDTVKKEVLNKDFEEKDVEIKSTDIKNNQKNTLAFKENVYQSASITAVENIGFKHYQRSLRAYKNKQTLRALSWIDLALVVEKKDEYLRLKVRVLMQKGDRAELHRFVLAQNDNTSLDWFQLIAPSLQMYAYYDLSNKYYSELIKRQPNDVKWQLAMALNYSKLEQNEKTYSIYKDLLNSSLLTYKQQRWISKRLGRIEQGKVAINER
jgi:tetratricopeptide (TPR) repeat protein